MFVAIMNNVEAEDDFIASERYPDKDADRRHFEHPRCGICFDDIKGMTEGHDRRGFTSWTSNHTIICLLTGYHYVGILVLVLPPIFSSTFLFNSSSLCKSLLQTLPLILYIIQQLRQLMSSSSNGSHRSNLFL